jgi:glucose-1-phosphate cytidylyltransferase
MQVIILCGGKGTRSYPFTEYYPKPMMPIRGTPILVHLMRIYALQGVRHFILAAGHRKEMLLDYFDGRFTEWKIDIVDTGAEADTGERILACAPYVNETFFATYGDGLGNIDLSELLAFHRAVGAVATVTTVPLRSQYGTVQFDNNQRVQRFIEKPIIKDQWINAGFFVFEKRVFECWNGKNLEANVLAGLAEKGSLYSHIHHGFWKSMDTSKDQQELEKLCGDGPAPWMDFSHFKTDLPGLASTNVLDSQKVVVKP